MRVDGHRRNIALEVVELTGAPGDAWLMDLRALHADAANAGKRPRLMLTNRSVRADLVDEIAKAWGWTWPPQGVERDRHGCPPFVAPEFIS